MSASLYPTYISLRMKLTDMYCNTNTRFLANQTCLLAFYIELHLLLPEGTKSSVEYLEGSDVNVFLLCGEYAHLVECSNRGLSDK